MAKDYKGQTKADKLQLKHIHSPSDNPDNYYTGASNQDIIDIGRLRESKLKALCGFEYTPKFGVETKGVCSDCMRAGTRIVKEASS